VIQGRDQGRGLPVTVRDRGNHSVPTQRATTQTGHLGIGPGFIDENQPARVEPYLPRPPVRAFLRDVRPVLLGGPQRFFLKVIRIASRAIQIADNEHATPKRSRNSVSVASGCFCTKAAKRVRSIFGLRPPPTRGAISPVSRRRCLSDRTHVRLTPYFSATGLVGMPASQSANTRLRKSIE